MTVAAVEAEDDELYTVITGRVERKRTLIKLRVKVDTGAQGNTVPIRMFRRMFPEMLDAGGYPQHLGNKRMILKAYNGTIIPHYGSFKMPCRSDVHPHYKDADFYVVEADGPAILGLPSSLGLRLITVNCNIVAQGVDQVDGGRDSTPASPSSQAPAVPDGADFPPLQPGEPVSVQDQATRGWAPGRVVDEAGTPRSYHVELANGRTLRQNWRHLRRRRIPHQPDSLRDETYAEELPVEAESDVEPPAEPERYQTPMAVRTPHEPPPSAPAERPLSPCITRYGRHVKHPEKLNLSVSWDPGL